MKKVLFLLMVSLLLAGVVSAASLHGEFEGFPIVKVESNGQELSVQDVPAVNLNGRTMVPIYMLRELGVSVAWDQENQTVNVDVNSSTQINEIDKLKITMRIADSFNNLLSLSNYVVRISDSLSITFQYVNSNNTQLAEEQFERLDEHISESKNLLNEHIKQTLSITIDAEKYGYRMDNYYPDILNSIRESIENYDKASSYLKNFHDSNSDNDFNNYLDHNIEAYNKIERAQREAYQLYKNYYNQTQM